MGDHRLRIGKNGHLFLRWFCVIRVDRSQKKTTFVYIRFVIYFPLSKGIEIQNILL